LGFWTSNIFWREVVSLYPTPELRMTNVFRSGYTPFGGGGGVWLHHA
jgi:hypothetical protein